MPQGWKHSGCNAQCTKLQSKAARQGCNGKAAKQGCKARLQWQGCKARLQGKAAKQSCSAGIGVWRDRRAGALV
jgi:hypothetical protein